MRNLEYQFGLAVFRPKASSSDERKFLGTGFLIAPDMLLTCNHVCKNGCRFLVGDVGTAHAISAQGADGTFPDVALLKLDVAPKGIEPLPLLVGLRKDDPK